MYGLIYKPENSEDFTLPNSPSYGEYAGKTVVIKVGVDDLYIGIKEEYIKMPKCYRLVYLVTEEPILDEDDNDTGEIERVETLINNSKSGLKPQEIRDEKGFERKISNKTRIDIQTGDIIESGGVGEFEAMTLVNLKSTITQFNDIINALKDAESAQDWSSVSSAIATLEAVVEDSKVINIIYQLIKNELDKMYDRGNIVI